MNITDNASSDDIDAVVYHNLVLAEPPRIPWTPANRVQKVSLKFKDSEPKLTLILKRVKHIYY